MTRNILLKHGPSWHDWILRNLERQCTPISMLAVMTKSTWSLADAATAIDEALAQQGRSSDWRQPLPQVQLPADGSGPRIVARSQQPHAMLLDGVLSAAECAELIAYAESKGLRQSGVVDRDTGDSVPHHARTSSSVFLTRAETPLIAAIEERLAALTNWPVSHAEGLQILRYEDGQEYKPHFDWFDSNKAGSTRHLQRGGQRVGTTVMYLACPEEGGLTTFPKVGLEFAPRPGGAVFFQNMTATGQPDELTLHAGTPVTAGTKIVMTYWQRERAFA